MSQRESNLLWLKDTLDHLKDSQEQLTWNQEPFTRDVLLETMLRDLECCRRLCLNLQRRHGFQRVL